MGIPKKTKFLRDAEKISSNLSHRSTILFNMGKYHAAVAAGNKRYANIDEAKNRAANIKQHALKNLSKYLVEFESNHIKNGGNVLWASNSHEALTHIKQILTQHNVTTVVKSKSMTTEEIELNEELEKIGIASIETDLGEYIVQLAGEKPYHIVTPAMHKSKQDVADLFHDKFGVSKDLTAEELTAVAGENLRKKYIEAGAGITGANFIVPDLGGIAVSENEGNAIMSTAFPN
ncbi:MAG TPA: LUD domain-containing protein, partial [Bacteroidales bacterium]|nr:LUD domain-containing protein [Bacteroidales bacterium]